MLNLLMLVLFIKVVVGLWVLSVLGSCCNFLTLFYIGNYFGTTTVQVTTFSTVTNYSFLSCSLYGTVHRACSV